MQNKISVGQLKNASFIALKSLTYKTYFTESGDYFIAFFVTQIHILMVKKEIPQRYLDNYFNSYSEKAPTLNSKVIHGICFLGIFFSLLGICWLLPFPHLSFLGQYNSYFNWASFVIAFSIYYYSKLSPVLSYLMLFLTLVFTYVISTLESDYSNYSMIQLYFLTFFTFEIIHYITLKIDGKKSLLKLELLFVLIGPIWLIHFILKRWSVKY